MFSLNIERPPLGIRFGVGGFFFSLAVPYFSGMSVRVRVPVESLQSRDQRNAALHFLARPAQLAAQPYRGEIIATRVGNITHLFSVIESCPPALCKIQAFWGANIWRLGPADPPGIGGAF
jgi:hypothetical protein